MFVILSPTFILVDLFVAIMQVTVSVAIMQFEHGIIGVHSPPPPKKKKKFRSPIDTKAPGPPLTYLVGSLAISDPHNNICVGPPKSCIALKQFNL